MSLQSCNDTTEATILEPTLGLHLIPSFKTKISVQLPSLNTPGQSISMWEVMEKLKAAISPERYIFLKVVKTNSTHIQLEGEHETRTTCDRALSKLRSVRGLKLGSFPDWLQVKAVMSTNTHPTRHDWTAFFRDARDMDEMKPGERPDTVHVRDIPVHWFSIPGSIVPCERLLKKTFEVFGEVRRLEVPVFSGGAFGKVSTLHKDPLFEVYIQYEDYDGFERAMDSLRGKKLIYKDGKTGKAFSVDLKVDFDRTNYLSDKSIKKRLSESTKAAIETRCTSSSNSSVGQTSSKHISIPDHKVSKEEKNESNEKASESNQKDSESNQKVFNSNQEFNSNQKETESNQKECEYLLRELLHRSAVAEKEKESNRTNSEEEKLPDKAQNSNTLSEEKRTNQELLLQKEQALREKLLKKLKAREQKKTEKLQEKISKQIYKKKNMRSVLVKSKTSKRT